MQEYKKTVITKDQVVPIAEKMRKAGNALVMIHGFIDNDGQMDVSWDYACRSGSSCRRTCSKRRARAR